MKHAGGSVTELEILHGVLHRLGFTPQVAAHRAVGRDEDAIAAWRSQVWAKARGGDRGVDLPGGRVRQALQPPRPAPGAARGHTPVVRVPGRGSGRISVAGLACMKAGQPGRFFYRMRGHRLRPGTAGPCPRQTTRPDHRRTPLPGRPGHHDLGQPQYSPQREDTYLHHRPPGLADGHPAARLRPDLNPVEGAWPVMKNGLGNLAAAPPASSPPRCGAN